MTHMTSKGSLCQINAFLGSSYLSEINYDKF